MIKRSTIDSVLEVVRIDEVVGEYVQLKRRGANLIGLCPFHSEKSPSFSVSTQKGIFKCFGCGVAGDSVGFVMDHDKLSYPEAIRSLAKKYNISIEEDSTETFTDQERKEQNEKESLYILNDFVKDAFHKQLVESEEGQTIGLSYFKERDISQKSLETFSVGYAFEARDALSKLAKKSGYSEDALVASGLVLKNEYGLNDRFKGRVMFPIFSVSGKVVGFGGRILRTDKKEAKYINSPESVIYHKSQTLYGISHGKQSIRKEDKVYLTEGYLDVIGLHQSGILNVVASSGTSLTPEQCRLIKRFTDNVTIVYDSDNAGQEATERAVTLLLQNDLNVRVISLPDGDDPDSFRKKNSDTALLNFFKEQETDFLDFLLKRKFAGIENDPIAKSNAIKDLLEVVSLITDPIKRGIYVSKASNITKIDEQLLINEVNKQRIKKHAKGQERDWIQDKSQFLVPEVKTQLFSDTFQEKGLIRLLLLFGDRIFNEEFTVQEYIFFSFEEMIWEDEMCQNIYKVCLEKRDSEAVYDLKTFIHHPERELSKYVIDLSLPRDISENWEKMHDIFIINPNENYKNDVESGCDRLKMKKILKLLKEIDIELYKNTSSVEDANHFMEMKIQLNIEKSAIAKKYGIVVLE